MHHIEFVIAPGEFGAGPREAVEPIIDGVSVIDIIKRADGEIAFAGLAPPAAYIEQWQTALERGEAERMEVLGCPCGYAECSHVAVNSRVVGDLVIWSDFWATCRPAGAPGPRAYDEIGQFEFSKRQYADALRAATHLLAPIRETHDQDALAAGIPGDPTQWLHQMTMAFGRDFLTPYEPEPTTAVVIAGLRSLRDHGAPVTDNAVRAWARGRRFLDEAVERYVEWFGQLRT